jgi:hypothetical protein
MWLQREHLVHEGRRPAVPKDPAGSEAQLYLQLLVAVVHLAGPVVPSELLNAGVTEAGGGPELVVLVSDCAFYWCCENSSHQNSGPAKRF